MRSDTFRGNEETMALYVSYFEFFSIFVHILQLRDKKILLVLPYFFQLLFPRKRVFFLHGGNNEKNRVVSKLRKKIPDILC